MEELTAGLGGSTSDWEYTMRRDMQEIVPGVFLGPYASAGKSQRDALIARGVTHIVCVRQDCEGHLIRENFPDTMQYLTLDIADSPIQNIIPFFPVVKQFIDKCLQSNGKVLVHGSAGISRSAALVVAFLMDSTGCTYSECLKHVQKRRFCVFPNEGFRQQLLGYEPMMNARRLFLPLYIEDTVQSMPIRSKRALEEDDADENME